MTTYRDTEEDTWKIYTEKEKGRYNTTSSCKPPKNCVSL